MEKYDANAIETLNFTEAVKRRIEMYMGSADNQGVLQCVREIISNSIDEFSIGYGNEIQITLDGNVFSCRDFGRSIPFGKRADGTEAMEAIFLSAHTGGKFQTKAYGNAVIGQNGTGGKGVALSAEYFIARSYRDGKCAELQLRNGEKVSFKITPNKTERTGTYIEFKPSQEVYRLEEIHIDFQDIKNMCSDWSYLNKGLKFVLEDKATNEKVVYFSKNGVADFIKTKVKSTLQSEPYLYNAEDEEGNKVEIAFQWGSKNEMSYIFTNGLHNVNGGTSLTGAKTGITRTVNSLAGQEYDGDFIRHNMCYVVNAKVPNASFSDQTKQRVNNLPLKPLTEKAFSDAIREFAVRKKDEFDKILDYLRKVEKADAAAEKTRNAMLAHEKTFEENRKKKIKLPDKLKDCEKHGEGSMLIICEGDSALAGLMPARDINTEALYAVRGKVKNLLKHPLNECLNNQEVSDIITALGCGIQDKYNAKRLNYGKVAIAVDADEDGKSIMCLITTLFWVLMPNFIQEGRLCWLRAPLYRLTKGEKRIYAYNDKELVELKKTRKDWVQGRQKGLGEMTAEDMEASMMNKDERRLEVLTFTDFEDVDETIKMLMGKEVKERKEYLFNNVDFSKLNR